MKPFTKTLLVTVVIVVAYFLFSSLRGGTNTNLQFNENTLTLSAPEKYSFSVSYDAITDLKLVEWNEPGISQTGNETRRYAWGEWEHKEFGLCTLCLTKKIDNAILVTTADGTNVLFNYESEQTTESIYEMLPKLLAERENSLSKE